MSAAPSNALDAIGFQLVTALEQYDVDVTALVAAWPDLERYRGVSDQVEKIRMYSAVLPEVRVQWVELLIAHAELVHFLWRLQHGVHGGPAEQIAEVRDRHADAVVALRNRCVRVVARSHHQQRA